MPAFDPRMDYYEILQVHPQAHPEVVKRAYHTILSMLQGHPDLGGSHEFAVHITEAYHVLSDPATRQAYDDARRRRQPVPATPMTPGTGQNERGIPLRATPASGELVVCPRCGAHNPVPKRAHHHHLYCGRCHSLLPRDQTRRRGIRLALAQPQFTAEIAQLQLTTEEDAQLTRENELHLRHARVMTSGTLYCMRCRSPQVEETAPRCLHCGSRHWHTLRLFRCGYCRHQFASPSLHAWPYWLYPICPACHRPHWHQGCEQHPLCWVLNFLLGV